MVFPCRLGDLVPIYGLEHIQWSRAFTYFINDMSNAFSHLLFDNLEYWAPYFPEFSEAIRQKIVEKGGEDYEDLKYPLQRVHVH
jgi:hypothetical protein